MKTIKLNFCDFWVGFNVYDNYFINIIKQKFEVVITDKPDFLIYSVFGNKHLQYDCVKIFYTGENIAPDMNYCDWAMTFDYINHPRHHRLPLYLIDPGDDYYGLLNKNIQVNLYNRKFCAFVHNNGNAVKRNEFFHKLCKYKTVDSAGSAMNNTGYIVGLNKREWIKNYKFTFAFENDCYRLETPGYTTEKIVHAMCSNSIPLYWGNPEISREFNKKSFVNYYDFKNEQEMIDYIVFLDSNENEYNKVMREPWLHEIPESNKKENIISFLFDILI